MFADSFGKDASLNEANVWAFEQLNMISSLSTFWNRWLLERSLLILAVLALQAGCSQHPSAVVGPDIDPDEAAAKAIEQYDGDGNGSLSQSELEACPGMLRALSLYDQNGDSEVSEEEIAARISSWSASRVNMAQLACMVSLDGRPLEGAVIHLVPEEFLQPHLKTASGKTSRKGATKVTVPNDQLPSANQGLKSLYLGIYRIEVTHPSVEIPARYNTETILGDEFVGQYAFTGLQIKLTTRKSSKDDGELSKPRERTGPGLGQF